MQIDLIKKNANFHTFLFLFWTLFETLPSQLINCDSQSSWIHIHSGRVRDHPEYFIIFLYFTEMPYFLLGKGVGVGVVFWRCFCAGVVATCWCWYDVRCVSRYGPVSVRCQVVQSCLVTNNLINIAGIFDLTNL